MFVVRPIQPKQGSVLILTMVFGAIFLILLTSFISSVITQNRVVNLRIEQQRATEIAEAGLNYYKWYLSHFPGDTSGHGQTYVYSDPEDGPIGEFSLSIASTSYCGQITSLEVESTGFTYINPDARAIISARYTRPTVAEYSFINNGAVWYGDSRVITGPVHGNQGVKMDGVHNSTVGSGQATFDCTSEFGCSPTVYDADGVYTTSGLATPGLFEFPVSPIDFAGITIDLSAMKTSAQSDGIYYAPTAGYGYWARFQADGTVDVYRVTNTRNYWSYSSSEGWHTGERNDITSTTFLASHTIDPQCPLLYFEDKLWIDGEITQKVSVAAANLSAGGQTNMVIADDVTYTAGGGAGLLAIAEDDVDVGIDVPNDMVANGIYIAQNGRFGRNHYCTSCSSGGWWGTNYGLPGALDPYVSRDSLTRLGSVVSNLRSGTEWSSGGTHISGFRNRITSFDRDQVDNPPPLTPETSDVYELQDWRQEG